jgi:hypothetical protein
MSMNTTNFQIPSIQDRFIYDLIYNCLALPTLAVAYELGLYDRLAETPLTIEEVATALSLTDRAAEAIVGVSAATGFLHRKSDDDRFALSEQARIYILPESPFSYGESLGYASFVNMGSFALDAIRKAVKHGSRPSDPKAIATQMLDQKEISRLMRLLHAHTLPAGMAIAEHPYFDEIESLLDVGAGSCPITAAVVARRPGIRVTALDVDAVCPQGEEMLRRYGLEDCATLLAGDMFAGLPTGFGAHLYSNIFHDWDVESCRRLAKISFDALEPGGRILLCEVPIDDTRDGPLFATCFTVAMLIRERGRQYSIPEFREMLTGAGFINFESRQIFGYYHLIYAQKPQ